MIALVVVLAMHLFVSATRDTPDLIVPSEHALMTVLETAIVTMEPVSVILVGMVLGAQLVRAPMIVLTLVTATMAPAIAMLDTLVLIVPSALALESAPTMGSASTSLAHATLVSRDTIVLFALAQMIARATATVTMPLASVNPVLLARIVP